MLSDPQTQRLIAQSMLGSVAVRGGSAETPAEDVSAGTFGGTGGGNYSFPGALSISANVGIGTPSWGVRLAVLSTVAGDVSYWILSKTGAVGDAQNITFLMPNTAGNLASTAGLRVVIEEVDANNARTGMGFITGQHNYTAERMRITGGGDVGIGTTAPAEKLDVAGKIKSDGLNKIIFLRPLGPSSYDSAQINAAIASLSGAHGGIIMLEPGEYRINTTISITSSGVKLRGYGAKLSDKTGVAEAVTKLQRVGSDGGTVVKMGPSTPHTSEWVGNLELSDLTIDGGAGDPGTGAGVGLELNRVAASTFRNISAWSVRNPDPEQEIPGGTGILLTTDATAAGKDTCFNHFQDCLVRDASQGVVLDGNEDVEDREGPSDSTQNLFENLTIVFRGSSDDDAGIWLKHCDANAFHRVSIFRGGAQG